MDSQLISNDIFPLKKTDTCQSALIFMADWNVYHLPVAENGKLLGYVSYNAITQGSPKTKIEQLIEPLPHLALPIHAHFFDIVKTMSESHYTCLAITNDEFNIEGIVSINEIIKYFNHSSLGQPGATIVLQMNVQDYSLAEIARITEYNDCKILNVFVQKDNQEANRILVSLKLNKSAIHTVIQTLERYSYHIYAVFNMEQQQADMNNRYDWLIKYLNT
jgi:acetoin utilization protein AcuB